MLGRLEHRAVVAAGLDHLLKCGLSALEIADFEIHVPHVHPDARAHAQDAAGLQRARQEPRGLLRLIQAQAETDEATSQIVVTRIARDDRREQLERAGGVVQGILAQDPEPTLHFDATRSAHLLELDA